MSIFETLPPITAGALATAIGMYPVDLVRALNMSNAGGPPQSTGQLLNAFIARHGYKGLVTQGVGPEMARATYMRVLKFFLFPICHEKMYGKKVAQGTGLTKAIAAGVASLPEGFTIQPLETAKISLQLDTTKKYNNSMSAVFKDIVSTRGYGGLFIGYFGVQYRQTSWTAAYFASLKFFQINSEKVVPKEWKKINNLAAGFAAGMFGAVFNTPGDVVRSTLQKRVLNETPVYKPITPALVVGGVTDFFGTMGTIVSQRGVTALYSGFAFKALHLGGSGALLATLIPIFKAMMGVKVE